MSTGLRLVLAVLLMLCTLQVHAAVVRVGASAGASGRTNDGALTHTAPPAGIRANDLLLAVVSVSGPAMSSIDAPPGWTLAGLHSNAGQNQAVFWRIAGPAEAGPYTFGWTFSGSAAGNDRAGSYLLAYRGVDLLQPVDAIAGAFQGSVDTQVTAPSVVPSVADTVLVAFWGQSISGGGGVLPASMGNRHAFETGAGPGGVTLLSGDQAWPPIAATGTRTASFSRAAVGTGQLLALRPASALDHLRLLHDGSGLTCAPESVTVQACGDSDCTVLYTGTVNATLAPAGWVGGNAISFSGGSAVAQLRGPVPGTATLGATATAPTASAPTRCFAGAIETCALSFAESGFLFDVGGLVAGQTSGPVSVRAVKADPADPLSCAPAFQGERTVAFWSGYDAPASGTMPVHVDATPIAGSAPGTALTLSFDASAEAQVTVRYDDAGLVSLHARHDGSGEEAGLVMLGSDQFPVRPEGLCVRAPQANAGCTPAGPGCSVFAAAGSDFTLEVRAARHVAGSADLCANPVTPNYRHAPVTLSHALLAPAGGSAGTLAVASTGFGDGDGGVAIVSGQRVGEVGVFQFTATPPATYFGLPMPAGTSAPVGRFTPHHFDVLVAHGCSGSAHTYSGQPFEATVLARNAAGATTANYDGGFGFAFDTTLSDAGDASGFAGNILAGSDYSAGVASNDAVSFTHASPPQPPRAISLRAVDADGVSSEGFVEGGTTIRSARLRVLNAVGSGQQALDLPLRVESWQDLAPPTGIHGWNTEAADSCTVLTSADFALEGVATTVSDVQLAAGSGSVTLAAPNAHGHADVTALLDPLAPWLRFDWDGDGAAEDPTARAGFELQSGSRRQIYRREVIGGN